MTHPALIERITRSLAYMLRHQPEKFDLELDKEGFGELDDVVRALGERLGEPVESADVLAAVEGGDRPRYELRGSKIRALYGHSIPVEPGEPSQPPEFLYVGIDARDLQRAQQYGLRGGRRRFLHLALSAEDAREAGRRAAREYAILQVFSMDAWEEGTNFYDRRTLYLCEQVPTQYLEVLERGSDGYEPRDEGGERGERGDGPSRRREERGGRGERSERGDRGPRRDDRAPRHEDRAPRHEDRAPRHEDRAPRHEDRAPRHEDRAPREERYERRDERGPRDDRFERRDERRGPPPRRDEPRREEPRRDEPRREEPRRETPRPAAPAANDGGGFGLGIFEEERKATPPPAPAPRPAPAAPAPVRKPVEDDFGSFGAGI